MTEWSNEDPYHAPPDVQALVMLHRAGWSIGDVAAEGQDGRLVTLVSGSNGENLIRVEGASRAEAWGRAVARDARPITIRGSEARRVGIARPALRSLAMSTPGSRRR